MSKPVYHKNLYLILTLLLFIGQHTLRAQTSELRITISKKNAPLDELFSDIHHQTNYYFYYKSNILKSASRVDIDVKGATLEEVLTICFNHQPLTYSIEDKIIVVTKKQNPEPVQSDKLDILGRITDQQDQPVISASITINQRSSIQSDDQGYFQLNDLDSGTILYISSIGFEPQSFRIDNSRPIRIHLKHAVGNLDEVQVIAYGSTTKRLNTGTVSTVSAKVIQDQPVSNPLAALIGEVPGMIITQNTGVPGGSFKVQIRGQNSVSNGTAPLYIIDGVPYSASPLGSFGLNAGINQGGNPLSSINPQDIESISVLKDADATAIYGSRGANGVILITTKKGKAGKTKLDVNTYTGWQTISRRLPLLNTRQYLIMRHEAFQNDGANPIPGVDVDLLDWDTTRNTDWQKMLIGGTSHTADVQGSLSGGNKNTQFVFSGNYHRETTVFPGDYQDRKLSGHLGLNHVSLNQKLTMALITNYISGNTNLPSLDITQTALTLPPDAPKIYDSYGKLNWENGSFNNPFGIFQTVYRAGTNNLISNMNLGYQLARPLVFRINSGYNSITVNEYTGYPTTTFNPAYQVTSGTAYFSDSRLESWILEPQLEFKPNFPFGQITVLIGSTLNQQSYRQQNLYATGFTSDNLLENIDAASTINTQGSKYTLYKYEAIFGRINYQYKERYLLNLTGRRDGSSRFGPGKQFANFGAIGAGWIFSNESVVHDRVPFINFGKLRASYGSAGNDQIGDYQYLDTWSPSYYPYLQNSTLVPTRLFNPDYGWEITRKMEAALDLSFLGSRIQVSVDYYRNRSSNQLIGYSLPLLTGFSSVQKNLPSTIQNKGLELEINTTNIKGRSFSWTTGLSLTFPRNELLSYPNLASSPYANIYQIGKPLSIVKTYHALGVNSHTGLDEFEDLNRDGMISYPDDLSQVVSMQPKFFGGLGNHFQYRNWSLDLFLYFVKQTGGNYLIGNYTSPGMIGNQPAWVMNRWQSINDHSEVQQFTQDYGSLAYGAYSNLGLSGNAYSDASFIRLKNISLSYQFPENLLKTLHLTAGRIYFLGQNLITATHYRGMDPENQNLQALPPLRVLTGGIQFTL